MIQPQVDLLVLVISNGSKMLIFCPEVLISQLGLSNKDILQLTHSYSIYSVDVQSILAKILLFKHHMFRIKTQSVDTSMKLPTKFNYLAVLEAKVVTNTIPLSGYVIGIHHYRKI